VNQFGLKKLASKGLFLPAERRRFVAEQNRESTANLCRVRKWREKITKTRSRGSSNEN